MHDIQDYDAGDGEEAGEDEGEEGEDGVQEGVRVASYGGGRGGLGFGVWRERFLRGCERGLGC